MPKTTERTSFTKDIEGRYLCNDIAEVKCLAKQRRSSFRHHRGRRRHIRCCDCGAPLVPTEKVRRWTPHIGDRGGIIYSTRARPENRNPGVSRSVCAVFFQLKRASARAAPQRRVGNPMEIVQSLQGPP